MAKIYDMQKSGISMTGRKGRDASDTERREKIERIIPTFMAYADEAGTDGLTAFLTSRDGTADRMMKRELPKSLSGAAFTMTRQSFLSERTYFMATRMLKEEDMPPESVTYVSEVGGTRLFFSLVIKHSEGLAGAGIVRIRKGHAVERYTDGAWTKDADMESLFDAMRGDFMTADYVLNFCRRINLPILITEPQPMLEDVCAMEPLLALGRKLNGCAMTKTVIEASRYGSDPGDDATVLASSDPYVSGACVSESDGKFRLMQMYCPDEEKDGLAFFEADSPETQRHIRRTVYETDDPDELLPVMRLMWDRPNRGRRWEVLPLTKDEAIFRDLTPNGFGSEVISANGKGAVSRKAHEELERLNALPNE